MLREQQAKAGVERGFHQIAPLLVRFTQLYGTTSAPAGAADPALGTQRHAFRVRILCRCNVHGAAGHPCNPCVAGLTRHCTGLQIDAEGAWLYITELVQKRCNLQLSP